MMKKLSLQSLWPNPLICTLFLGLIPLLVFSLAWQFYRKISELDEIERHLIAMHSRIVKYELCKEKEAAFYTQIEKADPQFLEKYVESLVFLEPEMKKLQALSSYVKDDELINERLSFLKTENQLKFIENDLRQEGKFKEVEYKIEKPIQVDKENLKQLLSLLENRKVDSSITPPQITIKEFHIEKKEISKNSEVYELSLSIIKREKIPADSA
jgi:hypothetical protein